MVRASCGSMVLVVILFLVLGWVLRGRMRKNQKGVSSLEQPANLHTKLQR